MKKRKYVGLSMLLILLVTLILYILLFSGNDHSISPKKGLLDLGDWKETNYQVINLTGEWEFYWKKLLYQDDFNKNRNADLIVKIPTVWNSYHINGKKLTGYGFATYRLHVKNASSGTSMAIRMFPLSTAYKVFIDGELLGECGIVGNSSAASKAGYRLDIFEFTPKRNDFDIIIQVSNYTYARGGMWTRPQLGTVNTIKEANQAMAFRDCFFTGCFLLMSILSLITYLCFSKVKSYLYFTIICTSILLKIVLNGYSFIQLFPGISDFTIVERIDYSSASWFITAFVYLYHDQFLSNKMVRVRKWIGIFNLIYTFYIFLLPISIFSRYKYLFQLIFISIFIFYVIQLVKSAYQGRKNALLLLAAFLLFFIFMFIELLVADNFIKGNDMDYFFAGCFVLLFILNILIIKNYLDTMKEKEVRLIQIQNAKMKEYETELRFLKSQIKPHFIHNAINAVISISRVDMDKARSLLVEFSRYLRNCFDFDNLYNLVLLDSEISFVESFIAIEKARFGDKMQVYYDIEFTDILIPPLILQPLVENAVIHGIRNNPDGGTLTIYVHKTVKAICIGVKDNGPGITEKRITEVLNGTSSSKGIGLYNINKRLNKLYGSSLYIENMEEGGVNVYMMLRDNINSNVGIGR